MSELSEHMRTFAYDEYGNVLEEHNESIDREGSVDTEGNMTTSNETTSESWGRYEYRYDERGNWVEKLTLQRQASDRNFHRWSIERRTITYFDSPDQTSSSASDQA